MIRAILFLGISLILVSSCSEEPEELDPSTAWGINFSASEQAGNAYGYISYQSAESNQSFLVDAGSVRQVSNERYKITYNFASRDSLRLIVAKRTDDPLFAFPKPDTVNQLLFAIFNADTLRLREGSVSIQSQYSNNSLRTFANLQVWKSGTFNGTVDGIPLLQ